MKLPASLKRPLLPLWNGGHRLAWRAGEYLDAIRTWRMEWCAVCGRYGPILYRRWVIPPRLEECWGLTPRIALAFARKESSNCFACYASLRVRRLANVLLDLNPIGVPPRAATSIRQWVQSPEARRLRIAEINHIEGLHQSLTRLPGLAYSEYVEHAEPGSSHEGSPCQDLMCLTYADASFDLVLTSETLEHVPDLAAALREIHRVLVPGGQHFFTVPVRPDVPRTFQRTVLNADGSLDYRASPVCHPGGDVGYPVFTEFGMDLPDLLRGAGFEVQVFHGPVTEDDVAQVYVCRKPSR